MASVLEAKQIGKVAAIATLILGFVPFVVLSLWTESFWLRSKVEVPLTLSPSILIGDSVLIPLFNRRAIPIIWNALLCLVPVRKKIYLLLSGLGALLSSFAVNVYVHILWARDAYTGFIDPEPGRLSLGGKWHCLFASVQMAIVLWFLVICFVSRSDRQEITRAEILRAWRVFSVYTTMYVADLAVMVLIVGRPLHEMSTADWLVLLPVLASLATHRILSRVIPEIHKNE